MMIDWTKPIQVVQNKAPARVLCTNLKSNKCPVVVALSAEGTEYVTTLTLEGCIYPNVEKPFVENVPQRHKHADVIIAWANGAEIECRYPPGTSRVKSSWSTFSKEETPTWANDLEYRVKPE